MDLDNTRRKKAIAVLFSLFTLMMAVLMFLGLQLTRHHNAMAEAIDTQVAISVWASPIKAPAWCDRAKELAADRGIGSSSGDGQMDPDVSDSSFVYYALSGCDDGRVSGAALDAAIGLSGGDGDYPVVDMEIQADALESLGFVKHEFTGFGDPYLLPGSILYAQGADGSFTHVEIYIGNYDLEEPDKLGNPVEDQDEGCPVTIGAKPCDGNPDAGDQGQESSGRWWGGEVSGGKADALGSGYWDVYYSPEKML